VSADAPASAVSTHVLDAAAGTPAVGLPVVLERLSGSGTGVVATATTDVDGRAADLGPAALTTGTYRLTFDTGAYFALRGRATFYPSVVVVFTLDATTGRHHVPLLLSPFAYTTYRGS
jgi:5-hydroxyisourate hydrolase